MYLPYVYNKLIVEKSKTYCFLVESKIVGPKEFCIRFDSSFDRTIEKDAIRFQNARTQIIFPNHQLGND